MMISAKYKYVDYAIQPHQYSIYGLNLDSSVPLPDLPPATGTPQITICAANLSALMTPSVDKPGIYALDAHHALIVFADGSRFAIEGGTTIKYDVPPHVEPHAIRHFLVGAPMNILLHQRGLLLIHAGAVVTSRGVVGVMGTPGKGKSTTITALQQRGYPIICDDTLVIEFTPDPVVIPGPQHVKLLPDAQAALGIQHVETAPISEQHPKRLYRGGAFAHEQPPLIRLIELAWDEEPCFENLEAVNAFKALITYSYAGHLNWMLGVNLLNSPQIAARHFKQCTTLAQTIRVGRFRRPQDIARLPDSIADLERFLK